MQIPLDRKGAQPLYRQILDFIEQQIRAGNLAPGTMLPPIRRLSERLEVSKTIVAMAYAELEANGLVKGRVGQGTVVTAAAPTPAMPTPPPVAVPQTAPGAAVIQDMLRLAERPGLTNFTTISPAPEHMPIEAFGRCLKAVLQEDGPDAFRYEASEGYYPLRQAIARHLMSQGIVAIPEEVLVTAGAQQAIDLAVGGMVAPGDWMVVESPCYQGVLEIAARHGIRVAPVPVDEDGLVVDQLEPLFRRLRPRLLYTTPTFHNPTGTTLSLSRRHKLVELALRWNVTIIEDGVCSDMELTQPAPPALRALDGPVIHCGSFSKALMPGIRTGYLVAAPDVVRRLTTHKQATDIHNPGLTQRALTRFLSGGLFEPHLRRVLPVYRQRRGALLDALSAAALPGARWTEPTGGLHTWITLPPHADVSALYVAAVASGVGFTPGAIFFPAGGSNQHLRLSYGAEPPDRIRTGIAKLAELLRL